MVIARDTAETLALRALGWLISRDTVLPLFLEATGAAPGDFAGRIGEHAFQIAVLDFLMQQDDWVIAFCDEFGYAYPVVDEARQSLPGGARVHWT